MRNDITPAVVADNPTIFTSPAVVELALQDAAFGLALGRASTKSGAVNGVCTLTVPVPEAIP